MSAPQISAPVSAVAVRQVDPATDDEIKRIVEIQFSAFEGDPYQEALYPGDYYSEQVRHGAFLRTKTWHESDPSARWLVAEQSTPLQHSNPDPEVEASTSLPGESKIIGFAIFNVYPDERPESEWRKPPVVDWCTGRQKEIATNFLMMNQRLREKLWAGRPYILLNLLCVHQLSQRQGAGKALVMWGMRLADEMQLPIHIEASPAGFHLYEYLGFEEATRAWVKKEEFDGDEDREYVAMVRQPAKPTTV